MTIESVLQISIIIISLAIVKSKDNLYIVIYFAIFSLITASLYYLYKAPDVALAEVSIGSAIIPLIFIIAISKQKQFTVINRAEEEFMEPSTPGRGYVILTGFCKIYGLKLRVSKDKEGEISGVFRHQNTDLIVQKDSASGRYIFIGKSSSLLMNKLQNILEKEKDMMLIKKGDEETLD
jgi:putative multicomponent Na+:H+ antiporter subunit B